MNFDKSRLAVFASALAPMSIWLVTGAQLARPAEAAAWGVVCACAAATLPSRTLLVGAWLQVLLIPLTVSWIGAVAVSGAGPSIASTASISAGAFHEVLVAMQLASRVFSFWLVCLISIVFAIYALRVVCRRPIHTSNVTSFVFLLCLAPLSLVVLDAGGRLKSITQLAGPEPRVSVTWLSHLQVLRELGSVSLLYLLDAERGIEDVRQVSSAQLEFATFDGVAVFIIGESLRADALLKPGRGPWSDELIDRLQRGLGVRLPDACSGSNATFASVKRLLTAVAVDDVANLSRESSFLAKAKVGGAATAFINNHEVWVFPELGHDFMLKTTTATGFNGYDEVTVQALGDFIKRTKARSKAAVLHLYGQHFQYVDRFPANAFPPEPSDLSPNSLLELRYSHAAEYGLKTLLLAAELLDKQAEPSFLIFTSDHGENLPSDETGKRYHAGPLVGRADTTVPVLVLWNEAFKNTDRLARIAPLLAAKTMIAHRDVARAWLALIGAPGIVEPTPNPMTWGVTSSGGTNSPPSLCSSLPL